MAVVFGQFSATDFHLHVLMVSETSGLPGAKVEMYRTHLERVLNRISLQVTGVLERILADFGAKCGVHRPLTAI